MKTKQQILDKMALFRIPGAGIGAWLSDETHDAVFERLGNIEHDPLSAVQLNQLLVLGREAPITDGFFRYYWLEAPQMHPYIVRDLPGFQDAWIYQRANTIQSLDHLSWGLYRLYMDALLYFGNVRTAFRTLRELSFVELQNFFVTKRYDTKAINRRGPPLAIKNIEKDQRYLISEMACKSYGDNPENRSDLKSAIFEAYEEHVEGDGSPITIRNLLQTRLPDRFKDRLQDLSFSVSEILHEEINSKEELEYYYERLATRFSEARNVALENTDYYLSMLTDLDVYVATSMRTPEDFTKMAEFCVTVFSDQKLAAMNPRYFDPTLSAAKGHEDKGLIECLMVKCAKALVYCRGSGESYGKDAEAAMALSLGRPVIFYCEERGEFYRDTHPLSRLIDFSTGVAVGAMVAEKVDQVSELLRRIFENRMEYTICKKPNSESLQLIENVTGSVVRIQTGNELLSEAFWNHYHMDQRGRHQPGIADVLELHSVDTAQRSAANSSKEEPTRQHEQFDLIAARSSPKSDDVSGRARVEKDRPKPQSRHGAFPLSIDEVFEGLSSIKTDKATGVGRLKVLKKWIQDQTLAMSDVIALIRFIETTLNAQKVRPNYVYRNSDLDRWYMEMENNEPYGSIK